MAIYQFGSYDTKSITLIYLMWISASLPQIQAQTAS